MFLVGYVISIPEHKLQHWLMRLEILICALPVTEREIVALNLQLPKDSIQRVKQLDSIETAVVKQLPDCQLSSQIYWLLHSYKYIDLILLAVKSDRANRRVIWQYLTRLSQIQPILNGNDLKELGYKPSPQFKQMLDDLLAATLDRIELPTAKKPKLLFEKNINSLLK